MNWLSLLGLEGLATRWRANIIEAAIAAEDRVDLARLEWLALKQRLQQLLVLTVLVVGLTVVALVMASLAVVVHFWDTPDRALVAWLVAGVWAPPARSMRSALVALGAIVVFAGVFFGISEARQTGTKAPDTITVDGHSYSLSHGRVFLFFYDPECMHCDRAARMMSKYDWKDTRVVAIPTRMPQFAAPFLSDTGLKAGTSLEAQKLKSVFPFGDPPYGVALENGHEKSPVSRFEGNEPADTLRKIGFIQ